MTVTAQTTEIKLAGNGVQTAFAFSFQIPYQADGVTPAVVVTAIDASGNITTKTYGVDYTISGVGGTSGGVVTMTTAPASGTYVVIQRALAYTQPTAVSNTSFYPHYVETGLDTVEFQIQQLATETGRSLVLPPGETAAQLPSAVARAGLGLGFDANGNPTTIPVGSMVSSGTQAYVRTKYIASASQTSFAVVYYVGLIEVYINGVLQTSGDYTAVNGTTVVLAVGATAGDVIDLIAFTAFSTSTAANLNLTNALYTAPYTGSASRTAISKFADTVCVKDFGAVGDGSTDDTAAFNSAHTAAAAVNGSVYVPGTAAGYKISGTIVAKAPMYGDGFSTVLTTSSATANVITCAVQGVTLRDFQITTSVTRTAGNYISTSGAYYFSIVRVHMFNWWNCVSIGGAATTYMRMVDCFLNTITSGGTAIVVNTTGGGCVDHVFQNVLIGGPSSGAQCSGGILINNAGDITLDHVSTVKCGTGLNLAPGTGQAIQALYCTNSFFDSGTGTGVQFNMTGTGSIQLAKFVNVWSCTNTNGFVLGATASGTCLRSEFINCVGSNNAGGQGFIINYTGVTDTLVYGGSFSANTNGFYAVSGVTKFKVRDVVLGATGQFAANSSNGLVLAGSNDNFNIEGCSVTGYSISAPSGTPGQSYYIKDNQGVVTSAQGQPTLTAAATTTTVTHGLAATPRIQDIRLTNNSGWGTAGQFWVTNPTTTQFTITTSANPGAGVLVSWDARVWGA